MRNARSWLESAFETFLFNSRLIVLLAVLGSLTSSVLMFVRGVILIEEAARSFLSHIADPHGGEELSIALISSVDSFLFATVLLIFAMGIYELFISKIDPASRTDESRPNWLKVQSLDDLKGAVGKVILMILIVRLFETAVKMKYERPMDLLFLGLGVLFVAVALYLQHMAHKHEDHGAAKTAGAHAHGAGHAHGAPASIPPAPAMPSGIYPPPVTEASRRAD